ncbi:hypothetical protein [Methyloversatilis sp.]|uniref:hypothetical protein n=1 Tax=Methyloversatilis sp. TaxID=2569862 RepID=UPI002733F729|nr:hypothetical protein [Methyloversatilis sp.]
MLRSDSLLITPEILSLIARIDEFKGAWRALGRLAPERLSALRRVSDELRARIASAAQQRGKTAHAFMVEALELQTDLAQRRSALVADALLAREEVARDGLVLDADEVFDYLKARADGRPARKPTSRSDLSAI